MKIAILLLLTFRAVWTQDAQNGYQQYPQEAQRRSTTSYATSIMHGDKDGHHNAQSSVKVNLNAFHAGVHQSILSQPPTPQTNIKYSQPDPIRVVEPQHNLGLVQYHEKQQQQIPGELKYQALKQSGEDSTALYYQRLQPQVGHGGILQYHGPTQSPGQTANYLPATDPNIYQFASLQSQGTHLTPTIIQKDSQPQLYNVGYSINIENSAPKLMYRLPNPQAAHSYRQQKLLNGDVITGTHIDKVEKPSGLAHATYEAKSGGIAEFQQPANYIALDQSKGFQQAQLHDQNEKSQPPKVYSDVRNTHGYTWKSLSPGVEISGYHSLEAPGSNDQRSYTFDHAAALGRSQGFDISNVVENGNAQYQTVSGGAISDIQNGDFSKQIAAPTTTHTFHQQVASADGGHGQSVDIGKLLETATTNFQQQAAAGSLDHAQNAEIPKLSEPGNAQYQPVASALTASQPSLSLDTQSTFKFPSVQKSGPELLNYHGSPFRQNLLSGSNIEFDKSLFDNFYKNFKPAFYSPEVTLPIPQIPTGIRFGSGHQNSIQLPSFDYKFGGQSGKFPGLTNQFQVDPQLMINQHYAFSQAEGIDATKSQALNLFPVQSAGVKPVKENQDDFQGQHSEPQSTIQEPTQQKDTEPKDKPLLSSGPKKYYPAGNALQSRPYGSRPVMYVPEKAYRLKTNLRPPPVIVIHQKY